MTVALFDLDNTLLGGDSDYLWAQFLIEEGVVDRESYERENERYFEQYKAGTLDIHEFLRFQLRPLGEHPVERLHDWRERFLSEKIEPIVLPKALQLVERHRRQGHVLVIITATNRFITGPIARRFGVSDLIATEAEMADGRYTGRSTGVPCFREGKVTRLNAWLQDTGNDLDGSWFYSDSHNDLPLLRRVAHPVAVDPDERLAAHAQAAGWPAMSLRGAE